MNGTWVWDKNILDPLTYDLWADGQPSLDGECGNFYGSSDGFGLNDHPCTNLEGYIVRTFTVIYYKIELLYN